MIFNSIKINTDQAFVVASFPNLEHADMNYLHQAVYSSDAFVKELAHNSVGYAVDTFDSVPYFVLVPFDGDDSLDTCHAFVPHAFVMLDTVPFSVLDIYTEKHLIYSHDTQNI